MFVLRTLYIYLLLSLVEGVDSKAEVQYLKQFFKVQNAHLKDGNSLKEMKANADTCSKTCSEDKQCLSFEVNGSGPSCKLYSEDSRDRRLIKLQSSDYYQLIRVGMNRVEYESCPIDVIYEGSIFSRNDLGIRDSDSGMKCLTECISHPDCVSVDYEAAGKQCFMSTFSPLITGLNYETSSVTFYINRTRWTDFKKSHKMEDVNSVGCGIREFESYFVSQGGHKEGSSVISSFSVKKKHYPSAATEAVFSTESTIQCASSCSLSETCVAFSHYKNTCTLKKDV